MHKNEDSQLKCSFCGKSEDEVNQLIAGPGVYICDECIEFCSSLLDPEPITVPKRGRKKKEEEERLRQERAAEKERIRYIRENMETLIENFG